MRIGYIGDLHVGRASRWVDEPRSLDLHRRMIRQAFALCHRHRCTHAVVMGDTFDTPTPNQERLTMVVREFAAESRLTILVLAGNHDVQDASTCSLTLLRELPGAGALTNVRFLIKPSVLRWDDLRVMAVPWNHRLLEERCDMLVFHEAVKGARMDSGHASPRGLAGVVESGVPAWAGHLHVPQRRGNVTFVGTSAQMSFGEPPQKWFHYADVGRDGRVKRHAERIRDPVWTLKRVEYDQDDPPECNAPNTFYSLNVSQSRPGPRWMVDHPQVVSLYGGSATRMASVERTVVNLVEKRGQDDRELLQMWLRKHSGLDEFGRMQALKIHDRNHRGARA